MQLIQGWRGDEISVKLTAIGGGPWSCLDLGGDTDSASMFPGSSKIDRMKSQRKAKCLQGEGGLLVSIHFEDDQDW